MSASCSGRSRRSACCGTGGRGDAAGDRGHAHEDAVERMLEWIEVEVIRHRNDGIHRVWPPHGPVVARFRHHEARSGRPLRHDAQRAALPHRARGRRRPTSAP
ncbi:relaxase domain-containing protein [Streptomyces alfalfae]|uniref:relaxase domain-containing protein n=1 Tax=Streptomyces alfalfae TaxID=1642299 RepID=UPI00359C79E6